ncbi:hypothetical protein [Curtobacterium sp. RIT-PI-V]|uniref:hypothetical protein n=1 Tax=Curtobacterium sp. RIT-PI-V TaxID=3035296 RepID=UPI0021D7B759|nr:hypothetical protein [Curtobacterium sp. RIT-PI-V]
MGNIGGVVAATGSVSLADKGADLIVALVAAVIIAVFSLAVGGKGKSASGSGSPFQQVTNNSGTVVQAGRDVHDVHIYDQRMSIQQNVTVHAQQDQPSSGAGDWWPFIVAAAVAAIAALGFVSYSNLAFGLLIGAAAGGAVGLVVASARSARLGVLGDRRVIRIIIVVLVLAAESVLIVTFALHRTVWGSHRLSDFQALAESVRGNDSPWSIQYPAEVAQALHGPAIWLSGLQITVVFLAALVAVLFAIVQILEWQNMLRIVGGTVSSRASGRAESFAEASVKSDFGYVLLPVLLVAVMWIVNALANGDVAGVFQ